MNNPPLAVNKQRLKFPLIQHQLNRALSNWVLMSKAVFTQGRNMIRLVKNETCFVMRSEEVIIAVVIAI